MSLMTYVCCIIKIWYYVMRDGVYLKICIIPKVNSRTFWSDLSPWILSTGYAIGGFSKLDLALPSVPVLYTRCTHFEYMDTRPELHFMKHSTLI